MATEKKAVLNAVSWYDETARRVIKKKVKLTGDKLKKLLDHLGCEESDLPDFGFYPLCGKALDGKEPDGIDSDAKKSDGKESGAKESDGKDGKEFCGKKGEYLTFEPRSDLRDHESVPLKGNIHNYFKREVLPHVPEAWINLDSVKIGYEISFNKYFYRHKPLRSMEAVANDILELEQRAEGLIADILGVDVAVVSGVGS
jgi:type I restriction enzyme M protein